MTGEDLAAERLAAALTTRCLGRPYVFLPSCASTNDEAATRAAAGASEGLVVAADEQSRGRGRRGRVWHSPPGQDLYFSILLRPALPVERSAPITLAAGAALAEALARLGFAPRLKWPNDVLLDTAHGPRKVAGILAEMASEGGHVRHIVLGIGINVNSHAFPAELAAQATSLALVRGEALDRCRVLVSFLAAFEQVYRGFVARGAGDALKAWRQFARFGQACWIETAAGRSEGVAEGVDETGALLMRTRDGKLRPVHAGEVNWVVPAARPRT